MVSNPEQDEQETKADEVEAAARVIIAGHPQGAVRRIVLYIVLALCVFIGIVADGPVGLVSGGFALVALLLLSMTDQLA